MASFCHLSFAMGNPSILFTFLIWSLIHQCNRNLDFCRDAILLLNFSSWSHSSCSWAEKRGSPPWTLLIALSSTAFSSEVYHSLMPDSLHPFHHHVSSRESFLLPQWLQICVPWNANIHWYSGIPVNEDKTLQALDLLGSGDDNLHSATDVASP